MSTPAGIAGIVVGVVIGTPLLVAVLMLGGYFLYKYFKKHPLKLHCIIVPRKPRISTPAGDRRLVPPVIPAPTQNRLDFDNEAFLNAMSPREVDPDQLSQSETQKTFLSALTKDWTPSPSPLPQSESGDVKNISNNKDVRSKPTVLRTVLSEPRPELLKATRKPSTHSPIQEPDDLNYDFSNPAFQESPNSSIFHSAALTLQRHWRGQLVRRQLPQLRLEKMNKDRLSLPKGLKPTASLANLRFYDVRGYGYVEVEQLYGLEVVRSAVKKLKKKYGNKGRVKMKIIVTPKGVKLFDTATRTHAATVKIEGISFCSLDPNNRKIFAFINRKQGRNFCHVFQCNEEDSQELVEVCAEAFERVVRHHEGVPEKRPTSKKVDLSEQVDVPTPISSN